MGDDRGEKAASAGMELDSPMDRFKSIGGLACG